jgi:hypothetical protein
LFTGLLDTYAGAAAAYSLRRLSKIASSVVRVRRASDNAEADFKAKEVSDGTLTDWVAEEQVGWNVQPTWDVSAGDGVISSQSSTSTTSTFSITTTSGTSFVRQSSKPNHIIASSGDQVVANITLSGFDGSFLARLRTSGTNTNVAQRTLSNGTADYTFTLTGSAGYFAFTGIQATSGATITVNSIKVIGQSGFVETWYDQSGNGNDAVQQVSGSQPKIVDGGVLVSGGLDFDGVDDFFEATDPIDGATSHTSISVIKPSQAGRIMSLKEDGRADENWRMFISGANNVAYGLDDGTAYASETAITLGNSALVFGSYDASDLKISLNGGTPVTSSVSGFILNTTGDLEIGRNANSGGNDYGGKIEEVIIYNSDQSANRAAIETNINDHYDIYA